MNRDQIVRAALWASVPYNVFGAYLFAFPDSALARMAGLPPTGSPVYTTLLAFFVLLFGGSYAWQALQPGICRPLLGFTAIGKLGVFTLTVVFCLNGHVPVSSVVTATGDLVLAAVFVWWLLGPRPGERR